MAGSSHQRAKADVSTPRLYSFLQIKSIDEDQRIIEGIASTPAPDRSDDIVEPLGAKFKLPLVFLWQHGRDPFVGNVPVGHVIAATPNASGIPVRIQMARTAEAGRLKDILDFCWQAMKKGLVKGLSIGMRPIDDPEQIKGSFGLRFTTWEWLELSAVTIAANQQAEILTLKSLVDLDRSASGAPHPPGVSGLPVVRLAQKGAGPMRINISERKAAFVAEKSAKVAKLNELMGADEGATLDANQQTEFDTLKDEVAAIEKQLANLETLEQLNVQNAVPVNGKSHEEGVISRSAAGVPGASVPRVTITQALPKGIGFARSVKARVVGRLDGRNPIEVAKEMYPSDDRLLAHLQHDVNVRNLLMQIKAAVPAATTALSAWAGALVDPTNLAGEFIEFLRPDTIIGRLQLRSVPTNIRLIEQTQGGTGYWVGQGAPKPLTALGYAPITLSPTKVAAICVATEEALRYSTPSLDMLIRDGLKASLVERVDRDILDPAEAGTALVQPASLTNGITALTSSGTSADNVRTDIARLIRALRTNNLRGRIAIVMPDSLLTALAWMTNSLGQPEFPGLTGDGGTFNGIRFIGSEYVANASGAGNMVVAIAESEVFVSDDGGVTVDASREASLQMLDNPTNNAATGAPTTMVSMWQTNSVAFRGEWFINWQKRRATAVAFIDDANWGSVGSPA